MHSNLVQTIIFFYDDRVEVNQQFARIHNVQIYLYTFLCMYICMFACARVALFLCGISFNDFVTPWRELQLILHCIDMNTA